MCERQRYTLLLDDSRAGERIPFREFPDLNVYYVRSKNNLCPSHYDPAIKCISAGNLEATLRVDGQEITLNSQDRERNHENVVGDYSFMGEGVFVLNRARDQTYLVFTVCPNKEREAEPLITVVPSTGNVRTIPITKPQPLETLVYSVNEPFTIDLSATPSTGYAWSLELPSNITQLSDSYTPSDTPTERLGGEGVQSFVLKGTAPGRGTIRAIYKRPWETRSVVTDLRNLRVYEVLIVQ